VYYGRAELKISDHKPVFSLFEAKIRRENEEVKMEIEEKLIQKFKSLQLNKQQNKNMITASGGASPVTKQDKLALGN
jgi:hypothetical protein